MSLSKRYATKQAKARQRRRLQAHERQAQRTAEALHQALEDLGLPANLMVEIEGRLRSQHKLLGKLIGVMFPALFGCRPPQSCAACGAGPSSGPHGFLGPCPNAPGSSGCSAWARRCWNRSGALSKTRAPPPRAAGNGRGCSRTPCSKNMGHSWDSLGHGGAASISVSCLALMDSYSWWSLAMVAWSCQWLLPFDGLTRWGLGRRAGTS